MDGTTEAIATYVHGLSARDLSEPVRAAAKLRVLDTLACAWGAVESEPVRIARRALSGPGEVRLLGGGTATVENAAFINSLAARYLDFNDWSPQGHGHPSDMIPALLAVAEWSRAPGAELLLSVVAGYQAFVSVNLGGRLKDTGWDNGLAAAVGAAAGAAKVLGLEHAQIADAVGIAVCAGPSLQARSTGSQLSMWKGGAGPNSCRMGVLAALLAQAGMTGPDAPFESRGGVFEKVTGRFEVREHLKADGGGLAIERTVIKQFPGEIHGQAPIAAAIELRERIGDVARIESIEIRTYPKAKVAIAGPERWTLSTRESADHSYPYMVAVALLDGDVGLGAFEDGALLRTDVQELMGRIRVEADPEFTRFPDVFENEFDVRLRGGETAQASTTFPIGHPANPASRQAHDAKVDQLAGERAAPLRDLVARLEELTDVSSLVTADA